VTCDSSYHGFVEGANGQQPLKGMAPTSEVDEPRDWTWLPEHLGLHVVRGHVQQSLPKARCPVPGIQITQDSALIRFSERAGLLVENGNEVTVEWEPTSADDGQDASWMIQGWGVTLAWLQRGNLSLHAATVQIGEEVVAVAGQRGAGKSTTAMGLRRRGHRLLVDDVTLIEFCGEKATVTAYSRNVHLTPDSADALGVDARALAMLAGGRRKSALRIEDPPITPKPLDRIVALSTESGRMIPSVALLRGAARLQTLQPHVGRDGVAVAVLGPQRYFAALARLANSVEVQTLVRPTEGWTLERTLDLIEFSDTRDSGRPSGCS
jgi:hypothetical protein